MSEQRKPLVRHMYTADPSAHVFNDKIYVYPSHDIPHGGEDNDNGDEYQMRDYHVLSMDSLDSECKDNGLALSEGDVPWVSTQLWAPDAAYVNGKYYKSGIQTFIEKAQKVTDQSRDNAQTIRRRADQYAEEQRKKKTLYVFDAGSCFENSFEGAVYDVSNGGNHPVYRYAIPMFAGLIGDEI